MKVPLVHAKIGASGVSCKSHTRAYDYKSNEYLNRQKSVYLWKPVLISVQGRVPVYP